MDSARTTRLLLILLALSAAACAIAGSRAASRRDSALMAQDDLRHVRRDLAGLSGKPAAQHTQSSGATDVNRLVREAAASAGAGDALAGLEPGRLNDAGEIPVIVGFTPLSLRQLVAFIHTLSNGPAPVRTDAIELSAADPAGGVERWTATVTISVRSGR
jgi:hypothetical protein